VSYLSFLLDINKGHNISTVRSGFGSRLLIHVLVTCRAH